MRRKIKIKPPPELEIDMGDKVLSIVFSNIGFLLLSDKYEGLQELSGGAVNFPEFAAKYMHSYLEYRNLVVNAGIDFIEAFADCLCEYISTSSDPEIKKKLNALMIRK